MSSYTREEKNKAIELYYSEKLSLCKTVEKLGYPTASNLRRWVMEDVRYGSTSHYTYHSLQTKIQAVNAYEEGNTSLRKVAVRFGADASLVYRWVQTVRQSGYNGLIAQTRGASMPLSSLPDIPDEPEQLKRRCYELELDNAILRETIAIIKKDPGVDCRNLNNLEKTVVIGALNRTIYPLKMLLKCLQIARSSFYYHAKRAQKPQTDLLVRARIKSIFKDSNDTYGYRRVWMSLRHEEIFISEKVVRRLMSEEQLSVIKKKYKNYNSYQGEITPAPDNIINRDFKSDKPKEKWVTDITEMAASDGKVYLSPVIDCFDGIVVAWRRGRHPNAELTDGMLRDAVATLADDDCPLLHSDRGAHYRCPSWIKLTEEARLIRSMSKKGCSADNSACEGFFGRLKNEMYHQRGWQHRTTAELMNEIDNYINWYNKSRIKMSLGGMSPMQYRQSLGLTV